MRSRILVTSHFDLNRTTRSQPRSGLAFFLLSVAFLVGITASPRCFANINHEPEPSTRLEGQLLRQWLVLSHYNTNGSGRYSSEIVNVDFFVSPQGRTDPFAEFAAFKKLIIAYVTSGAHAETLCRFPARLRLLKRHDLLPPYWRDPDCPDFQQQNRPDSIRSVSLVFASGYFDNPSSYYGHILLKFNYDESVTNQRALDSSLNYGADATDNPSSPFYLVKGLVGGYTASYTRNNYFLHTYLYTNGQIRDTWEYELNLTAEQIQFLVEHSWEMVFARFKYYFFNDNCAHRIAKLVEVATGRDLSETHGFWLLPTQVVRKLRTEGSLDTFVKKAKYNPSLKSVFSARFGSLRRDERHKFVQFFRLTDHEKSQAVVNIGTNLLQLMLDYLDLEVAKRTLAKEDESSLSDLQRQRGLILGEMFRRPTQSPKVGSSEPPVPQSPIEMKPPSVLRIGAGVRDGRGFQTLTYRVANNDFLNRPNPGQETSRFIMGEVGLEVDHGSIDVRNVVLVDVVNINTNALPTSMTHERSWSFTVDYSSRSRLCSDCSNFGLEATVGKSVRPNASVLFYGFAGVRIHTAEPDNDNYFDLTSEVGSVINTSDRSIFKLSGHGYVDTFTGETDWHWGIEFAFNPKRRIDFRVSLEKSGHREVVLATFGYYFD